MPQWKQQLRILYIINDCFYGTHSPLWYSTVQILAGQHSFCLDKFTVQGQQRKHSGIIYDTWQLISSGWLSGKWPWKTSWGANTDTHAATGLWVGQTPNILVVKHSNWEGEKNKNNKCRSNRWWCNDAKKIPLLLSDLCILCLSPVLVLSLWLYKMNFGPDGVLPLCFNSIKFVFT